MTRRRRNFIDESWEEAKKVKYTKLPRDEDFSTYITYKDIYFRPLVSKIRKWLYGTEYSVSRPERIIPKKELKEKSYGVRKEALKLLYKSLKQFQYYRNKLRPFSPKERKLLRLIALSHEIDEGKKVREAIEELKKEKVIVRKKDLARALSFYSSHASPEILINESNRLYLLKNRNLKNYYKASRALTGDLEIMRKAGFRYAEEYVDPKSSRYRRLARRMSEIRRRLYPGIAIAGAQFYPEFFGY